MTEPEDKEALEAEGKARLMEQMIPSHPVRMKKGEQRTKVPADQVWAYKLTGWSEI